jgi:uncharacterized protein YqhQ
MEDRIMTYGGQAVIEGVLMRGRKAMAIAMRSPSGDIVVHTEKLTKVYQSPLTKIPFLRGSILLWDALGLGMTALTISANVQTGEDEKLEGPMLYLTLGFSLLFGIGLFFLVPYGVGKLVQLVIKDPLVINLSEGVFRLLLIMGYMSLIGLMPDIKRVFQYHGAEHKTINAYEAGSELTPEKVAQFPLEHPRCGTSFLLTLAVVSIFAFSFLHGFTVGFQIAGRILLIPVLAGISLEYIRWMANNLSSPIVCQMIKPNLWLQKLTTREPDLAMLEVSIRSFNEMMALENQESL